jgi:nicotinamidase-related amidase
MHVMSALLLVDVQHDFISGSLAVPNASDILPTVYDLLDNHAWDLVVASQVSY